MRFMLAVVAAVALGMAPAAAAAKPSPQVARLQAQVRALKKQNAQLRAKVAAAEAKLQQAQASVDGAIRTMTGDQAWALMPTIAAVFSTPTYSSSYYTDGTSYSSYSFVWCGFCT